MENSIKPLLEAFTNKISASNFFYKKINSLYTPNKSKLPVLNELFYYLDACIFELHAASQMLLQIINIKSGINTEEYNVSWNEQFKSKLKSKCEPLYNFWNDIDNSGDFWTLEATRQHIAHRNDSIVQVENNDEGTYFISLAVRYRYKWKEESKKREPVLKPTGKSIELLDELNSIKSFLEEKFKQLIEINKL